MRKIRKDYGLMVHKTREEKGIKLVDLARYCDVYPESIRKIEKGISKNPRFLTLVRIAEKLNIGLYDLLEDDSK